MKLRVFLTIFVVTTFAILSFRAFAHAPNAIEAKYDKSRGQLNIKVQHLVNDPWKHFVDKVTVYKNGREVWSQTFSFQTSHRNLTLPPVLLSAFDGDELRIVADCSEGGRGETTLTVGAVKKAEPSGPIEHDIAK